MTQEENAKAYDEALERAMNIYGASESRDILTTLSTIFPELEESEDERIRKGLIALLIFGLEDGSAIAPGFNETKEQALDWLEKQGKIKEDNEDNNVNECETNAPNAYGKYVDGCLEMACKRYYSHGEDAYCLADVFYAGMRCERNKNKYTF